MEEKKLLENIGFGKLFVVLLVAWLLFGTKKIPELTKGLAKGLSAFKSGLRDVENNIKEEIKKDKED